MCLKQLEEAQLQQGVTGPARGSFVPCSRPDCLPQLCTLGVGLMDGACILVADSRGVCGHASPEGHMPCYCVDSPVPNDSGGQPLSKTRPFVIMILCEVDMYIVCTDGKGPSVRQLRVHFPFHPSSCLYLILPYTRWHVVELTARHDKKVTSFQPAWLIRYWTPH